MCDKQNGTINASSVQPTGPEVSLLPKFTDCSLNSLICPWSLSTTSRHLPKLSLWLLSHPPRSKDNCSMARPTMHHEQLNSKPWLCECSCVMTSVWLVSSSLSVPFSAFSQSVHFPPTHLSHPLISDYFFSLLLCLYLWKEQNNLEKGLFIYSFVDSALSRSG